MIEIARTVDRIRAAVRKWRKDGLSVGFVPTMGYLHAGHRSLIERSVRDCDRTVVSIFVNPMQFAPGEDLSTYPRDLAADTVICEASGASLIFAPEVSEMYRGGCLTYVDMDSVTNELCGKSRPSHFRGVCTVVAKLFNIVMPDNAYFGQKDAQQLAVIRRMTADLNLDINIICCPIIRETDGLAMSSRNSYLNPAERVAATVLSRAVFDGERRILGGERDAAEVARAMREIIATEPLARIDYIGIVDADLIQPISVIQGSVLGAVAVFIGNTRLIDNFLCNIEERI